MIDFAEDVRGQSARFVSPIRFPQTVGNYASGALARAFDIRGPVSTVACGTASGLQAVIEACRWLDAGLADAAFAGGCETFSEAIARELQSSVPLAEGACLFALEREADARVRGARILASIDLGTGSSGTEPPTQAAVMASAGAPIDGSVFLETWTGCALAASGAAAIGGVIAARAGRPVPYHGAAGATLGKESGGQAVAEPSEPVRVVVGGHQGDSVWIELF
jgi:hypothetical protein